MDKVDDEKDAIENRLRTSVRTLQGHVSALQGHLKYWIKKYGKIDNLTKIGGEK